MTTRLLPLLIGAAAAALCLVLPGYWAYLAGTVATTIIVGAGLNVLLGLAGEVSLGHAGFMALGAYAVAVLELRLGAPLWLALPLATALAAGLGLLLSIPALRLTGPYLAMVTIAFGFIVENVAVEWQSLTGGASGLSGIPAPFGTSGMAALCCACAGLSLAAFAWLARSPAGLAMQAVATAPAAARSIGIAPLPVRTLAFVVAAAAGGLAGGLQAALTGFIAPSSFPFSASILFLLVVVVGGAGWTLGPLLGALVVAGAPELLSGLAEYRLLVFGALLLIVLWAAPGGLAGLIARLLPRPKSTRPASAHAIPTAPPGEGLQAHGLRVAFGGVVAVAGLDLAAPRGQITSVIGPNGAGKTTLLNLISGFQRPDAGTIRVAAADMSAQPAHRLARAGLARTFQTAQPFATLTVVDNVRLGLLAGRWRGAAPETTAQNLLQFVGYAGPLDVEAGALAHVDRRLLEIARALATAPAVLLLDEPAAGLDAADTTRLGLVLRRIAASGVAVVLVEHDMPLVMSISDTVIVLDAGQRIAAGPPAAVRNDPAVRTAYLGGHKRPPIPPRPQGDPIFHVNNCTAAYGNLTALSNVSLTVRAGETVAVLGPNGAGKSTLMKALSGLLRPVSGEITLNGRDLARLPAHAVARAGLVLVPEGRQVFPRLTVRENLRLGATTRRDFQEAPEIEAILLRFPKLRPLLNRPAGLLSGGEQQMLAVARGLLARPRILLLDEPSLGLAPAVAEALFDQLAILAAEGTTLVIVDQMADQVLAIATHGIVLAGGVVVQAGDAATLQGAALEDAYLGAVDA